MTLGRSPSGGSPARSSADFCGARLSPTSIYGFLHRDGPRLFPDEMFEDLFCAVGRWSVPPRIVAVVMVLQRLEGLRDREAVDRFSFDLRWKYAAGGLDFDYPSFVHTVLVDMRARLHRSARPRRIFEAVLEVAQSAGLVGRRRVLDSTPLYDAVATQDTVTLIRQAIRGLLQACDEALETELRALLRRDDDYRTPGKPSCDWEDAAAREALVDALARDAFAILARLDDRQLEPALKQAVARRVAPDRVISTVDPEARHGHKTAARGFDGYKGHIAIDPDSEIITATEVTPGNAADGSAAETLLGDVLPPALPQDEQPRVPAPPSEDAPSQDAPSQDVPLAAGAPAHDPPSPDEPPAAGASGIEVYGDSSYGTADLVDKLEDAGIEANVKVQPPSAPEGCFGKDAFQIDLEHDTVTCPAAVLVQIRRGPDGAGFASFGVACRACPMRARCTDAKEGRSIRIHAKEATLQRARARQRSETWKGRYRATRPKVERKLAHLMLRRHGGRRARVRGAVRIGQDFALLGAAHNLRRLASLGVHYDGRWVR